MQLGPDTRVDQAIKDIAALLAVAYQRRAKIRLVRAAPEQIASTERLAIPDETRRHELTLTGRRKDGQRS
jgi:hypothetical protein